MKLKSVSNGYTLRIAVGITVLALLLVGGAEAAAIISSCQGISSPGEYVLDTNLQSSGTCISITSSNVTFDGAGHSINGTGATGTYGISANSLTNITVKNLNIVNWTIGIYYQYINNGNIQNSNALNNSEGIRVDFSTNNTLNYNTAKWNQFEGIYLWHTSNSTLIGNNASNNNIGIDVSYLSNNNTLINNIASNNNFSIQNYNIYLTGIWLSQSSNNMLVSNNISNNGYNGIFIYPYDSNNNTIYNNYFNNTNNMYIFNSKNSWNITKTAGTNIIGSSYFGGNFWTNPSGTGFSQTCADTDNDGICDSPYVLDGNNTDYLPLAYNLTPPSGSPSGSGGGDGRIITVDDNGANYTRIQDAINNASTGNTILVYSGTYYENVNVTKQLILRGIDNGAGKPVVDAGGSGNAITISADGSTLQGFDAKNSYAWPNAGIVVNSESNIIKNNNVSLAPNSYGIYLFYSSNNTLSDNNVSNNLDGNYNNYGIYLLYSNNNTLSGNNVSNNVIGITLESSNNNTLSGNNVSNKLDGIYLNSSSNNTLSGNNAWNNTDAGIDLAGYSNDNNNMLSGNNVWNNSIGIFLDGSTNTLSGNNASNNLDGIFLAFSSGNMLSGNNVSKNLNGITLWSYSSNNILSGNNVSNNNYGIYLNSSSNNLIYNNNFNNTNNVKIINSTDRWNITKTAGTNIIGGPYLGGNFWAYPNGTGFSQTCADDDRDGICDSPSTLDSNNTDYLPLTYNTPPSLDRTKPSVTNVSIYPVTPETYQGVNITADVSDENLNISSIFVEIKNPKGYTNTSSMIDSGDGTYYYNYKNTSEYGRYDVKIIAADLAGNINDTERTWFVTKSSQYSSISIRGGGMAVKGYGPMVWNRTNFPGLVIKETLNVTNVQDRTIPESNLIYTTEAQPKVLKVVEEAFNNDVSAAAIAGLNRTYPGQAFYNGSYYVLGWQGQPYVALNGKVDKLAQLIFEQGISASDKKTLQIGKTWDVGGGWTLRANSIDARAFPKQVWLTLYKDGVKKDDRVIAQGQIYTYVEKSIAGENDVPMFVTFADYIFTDASGDDMVQFRYTWAISTSVMYIDSFKTYGLFNEAVIDNNLKILSLHNSGLPVNLYRNSTTNLMGDLFFIATDNASLEYYPFFNSTPPTQIDATEIADIAIEVITNNSVDDTIELTKMMDLPPGMSRSFGLTQFGKYFEINAGENMKQNLTWIKLKLYYTKAELDASHLDENSLKISWYNESADPNRWETLSIGSPEWVHSTGIEPADTSGYAGYVWANITHLSTFALVGNPAPIPTSPPRGGSSSGGGGGGGGGGGTSGENHSNIEIKEKYDMHIFKDKVTSYAFTNRSNPILFVNITGNINAGEISAIIETLRGTSTLVKNAAPGIVYKNANIWIGTSGFAVPKNIKEATIMFRVENLWLDSNNLARSEIKLVKWDGSKWIQLETSEKGQDNIYTYFEAKTDSFSPFAMTGIKAVTSAAPPENTVTQPEPVETPRVTTATQGEPLQINLELILGSFVLVAIIVVLYLKRK